MLTFLLAALLAPAQLAGPVGPAEQREITKRVHALLLGRNFVALQKEIDGLLASRRMNADGRRVLEVVLEDVGGERDIWEPLKAWLSSPQASHAAFVLEGAYHIKEAWRARGSGYSHTVSAHGSEQFERMLKLAHASLEKAWRMQPRDPLAPALLIQTATGLGLAEQEMETWFARAVEADPLAYAAYGRKLTYLLPKWRGSEQKAAAYADLCDRKAPPGSRAYTVKLVNYQELAWRTRDQKAFLEAPAVRADVDRLLARWLADFPNSPEAHLFAARMALSRSDRNAGRASLDRALALDPNHEGALLESGQLRHREKDYAGAARELERLTNLDPDNAVAQLWLGYGAETRQLDTALAHYDKAVSLDPTNALAWAARGAARTKRKLFEQAIADLNRAIEIDDTRARPYYDRGFANFSLARTTEAQADFKEAVRLADGLSDAEIQYAREQLRHLEGNARSYYQRAIEHWNEGRYTEAESDFREAIRIADGLTADELQFARQSARQLARYRKRTETDVN